jgi:hypothetical protein
MRRRLRHVSVSESRLRHERVSFWRSGCLKFVLLLLALFVGYRLIAAWLKTRHEHAPLTVIDGVKVTPILDPANFPPLEDIDPNAFDVAPDGSFVFRQGNRLVACDPRKEPPELSVLVEQEGLNAFAFDAGGSLLTISGGVLGVYSPEGEQDESPEKSHTFNLEGAPRMQLISTAGGGLAAQVVPRGVPSGPVGPVGPVGGGSYSGGGGGSGSSRSRGDWRFSHLFFKPPEERVSENAIGSPPQGAGGGGGGTYTIIIPDQEKKPQTAEPAALLPSTGMHLARTDRPGEMLLYGGNIRAVYSDVHMLRSDGTVEWLVSSGDLPVAIAAEANRQLYVVAQGRTEFKPGAGAAYDIIRLPLGADSSDTMSLVIKADALPGAEPIESIAVDPGGRLLYFSTMRKVYAVDGPLVVKVLDGLGGVLRLSGDALYVFNAKRRVLLSLTGLHEKGR